MLRIEEEPDGHTTTGPYRIHTVQMDDGRVRIFMDLDELTFVDVEVVRYLIECEDRGIVLVHCSPYVREWIPRERAEGGQPQVPNGV